MRSSYFLSLDGTVSCTINKTFKVFYWPTYIYMQNLMIISEGWQYGRASHRPSPNASWQEFLPEIDCEWLNGLTDNCRFLPCSMQDKNSVLSFIKCMNGSVLAFLKCIDGSVLAHLNGIYGSVSSHLRLPTQSCPPRFLQPVITGVPWLLCKKNN